VGLSLPPPIATGKDQKHQPFSEDVLKIEAAGFQESSNCWMGGVPLSD